MSPFLSLAPVGKPLLETKAKPLLHFVWKLVVLFLIAKAGVRKETDRSNVNEKQHSALSFFFIFVLQFRSNSGPEQILVAVRNMNE
jgi:hypothetical protein